ncbi:MAG: DNA gyrase subunit A, partial [Phycisphaerae bacterium]|nr:DNA gyrase subunit A [Phycisphaerae bacterium]
EVVGGVVCDDSSNLLTVCESGYGKRTPMTEYLVQSEDGSTRAQNRGGKGRIDIRTEGRNGKVIGVRCVAEQDTLLFTTRNGMMVHISAAQIRQVGRNTQGVRLVSLSDGDLVAAVAKVVAGDESEAEIVAPPQDDATGEPTDDSPAGE